MSKNLLDWKIYILLITPLISERAEASHPPAAWKAPGSIPWEASECMDMIWPSLIKVGPISSRTARGQASNQIVPAGIAAAPGNGCPWRYCLNPLPL